MQVAARGSVAVKGLPHSSGVVARREELATETAPAAQRLFDAGAVLLGLTNTSELCMWVEAENRITFAFLVKL